ncbi:MAG TPA: oligosaccharide flippase family protein [Anaerohalosphaeraceae bacterium]|nr:oligosaccharide flippase family protein [Anaerohalosphaeraceae bacterium]
MKLSERIIRFWTSDSLKARCARGSFSLMVGAVVAKAVAFASKVVLAKLLSNEERGVMIVIFPLVTFFETLTEIGVKQSVIQHKDGASESYLNMAWWIQAVRGVLLYALAFFLSPLLCRIWIYGHSDYGRYYTPAELLWMVRISFLTILLNGFVSPRSEVLLKEFRFAKSVMLVQGSMILSSVLTIWLSFLYRNVWAFVVGTISNFFFLCLLSYVMCPFRPTFRYDGSSFRSLMRFSKGMAGMPILTYLTFNLDVLVGSLLVSPALIGMYGFALILARTPREFLTRVFGPLLMPAFAEKQDNFSALQKGILWITRWTGLVIFPLTMYMILCRRALLAILYKPEFETVAGVFSLLCVTYALLLLAFPLGKLFFGRGKPEIHRRYVVLRIILLGLFIWPAAKRFSLDGIGWLLLVSNILALIYQVYCVKKEIGLSMTAYWKSWLPGLAAAGVYGCLTLPLLVFWPERLWVHFWGGGAVLAVVLCLILGWGAWELVSARMSSTRTDDSSIG